MDEIAAYLNPGARPARLVDVDRALRLEWLTLAWMTIEATVAIAAGVASGSLVLQAFGVDSMIELASAGVLVWRLVVELKKGERFPEAVEQRAARAGGCLLLALTAYVLAASVCALWQHKRQETSVAGLVVTGAAIPVMYWLATNKLALAKRLGSAALRSDAVESLTCGYLSIVVFAALTAQWFLGAWWVSGVGGLVLVPLLFREGLEAWHNEACCQDVNESREKI